jgi:hypothetical protein
MVNYALAFAVLIVKKPCTSCVEVKGKKVFISTYLCGTMIIVGNCLVSEELFENHFVCDLQACKGACCVEGESGAPLDADELPLLEAAAVEAEKWMNEEGKLAVQEKGLYEVDNDGDWVTPLVSAHGACAFVFYDQGGIAKCALEKAYLEGETQWKKPISCHLYPIRLADLGEYTALNYHHWPICAPACECGSKLKVPVYKFLKEPLIRKFGAAWYSELEEVYSAWKEQTP